MTIQAETQVNDPSSDEILEINPEENVYNPEEFSDHPQSSKFLVIMISQVQQVWIWQTMIKTLAALVLFAHSPKKGSLVRHSNTSWKKNLLIHKLDVQIYTHLPASIDGQEIPEVKQLNRDSRREVQNCFLTSEAS
jgi:hypothetical protein